MNIIEWKQDKIKGILSTFDRIIIKGYSRQLSNIRVVRKLKMWYNLSAGYERRKLESSLYGVTLIHI